MTREAKTDEAPFKGMLFKVVLGGAQYLPVLTVLCTSLGIMFDLGFFLKLGLSMFTLFSIAEHLLFAILTAPLFLGMICLL